jgi:hypothetical protein
MKPSVLRITGILFLLLILKASQAQFSVEPFDPTTADPAKDGIIYSLPRNVLRIEIDVVKKEEFKGPYSQYSTRLLGLTDVIQENTISFSLGDVRISSYAEPDPRLTYFIDLGNKSKKAASMLLSLSDEGYITGFSEVQNADQGKAKARQPVVSGETDNIRPFRDLLKPVMIEKVDTIFRRINVDTISKVEKILKKSILEKMPEQQAKEIADQIYKIQESKFNLISGDQEVNYSRESIEYMISKLSELEKEYIEMFKGTSIVKVETHVFYVTPQSSPEGYLESICRFSKATGISEKSSASGEAVNLVVTPVTMSKSMETFINQRNRVEKKLKGLYYRIPCKSVVSLRLGGGVLYEEQRNISQMGYVTFLPASGIGDVQFHQSSGSLIKLITE